MNGDGKPGVCKATKGGCPFSDTDGGTGLGHFDTKQEAEAAYSGYAAAMAKMNGTSSLSYPRSLRLAPLLATLSRLRLGPSVGGKTS